MSASFLEISRQSGLSRQVARLFKTAAGGTLLMAVANTAMAAEMSPALDRMSISIGALNVDSNVQLGVNTSAGRADTPDYNADRYTIPRIRADFLLGHSQGISLDYYRYDRSYSSNLIGNTTVNGQAVSGTANLAAKLRLELGQAAYKWWIGSGDDVFGLGLGAAFYRASIDGTVSGTVSAAIPGAAGSMSASESNSVSRSTVAPLLELGWRHAFSPSTRFFVEASGIKKNGGNINGHIYTGTVGAEWFPLENVGLVVDYGVSKISLERETSNGIARLSTRLQGPSAYVKVRF
ncbi:autotransporter outer membrane beta-barrel domain-containing protein [Undibacterium hunanense]|nr:autotransporter outer membrane beta-barrel domain-containing protein [Undibacterium hunanense]